MENKTDNSHMGHILPFRVYFSVLLALLALTIITVAVSRVDLGTWNIVVALLIASAKALLVALFFMHLKYEDKLTWFYAFIPVFLLILLISGVFIDNPFRG